jgi:hypothetical protein
LIADFLGIRAILHNADTLKERTSVRKDKRDQQVEILDKPGRADAYRQSLARSRHQAQRPVLRGGSGMP